MRILYHHRTLADGAEGIHIHEMIEASRGSTFRSHAALAKPSARGAGDAGLLYDSRKFATDALRNVPHSHNIPEYVRFRQLLRRVRPDFSVQAARALRHRSYSRREG